MILLSISNALKLIVDTAPAATLVGLLPQYTLLKLGAAIYLLS